MSEEKKKNLFDKAIDALTDRDEEAEAKAVEERVAAAKVAAEKAAAEQTAAMKAANEKAAADRAAAAAAPKTGVVAVRSLRIRADHNTTSEVVAGLVDGDQVSILTTWSDGKNTWAKLDKGWAAMVYDGETYIKLS